MTVAFISGWCCNIWQNSCKSNRVQIVTLLDTVVVLKATIDTLEVERIKTKTIYEKSIDTIYLLDSIAIDSAYAKAINRLQQLEGSGFFKR
jgi:Tfp pilus assembly protein PilN